MRKYRRGREVMSTSKLLLFAAPLMLALSLHAQAVVNDFSPTVKGVTIGTTHCYFWFHASVAAPYDSEAACYFGGALVFLSAAPAGLTITESLNFPDGSTIAWQFKPDATNAAQVDYQISGEGTADAVAVVETGTL